LEVKKNLDKPTRILVIDDDQQIRDVLKAILEEEGFTVDLAETGNEAIQKTEETTYNLTLIDIRLPDMDGTNLLKMIRDTVPKTRKIMMTGYPSLENTIASLNKGADAFLIKPVEIDLLLATLKEQLEEQAKERRCNEQTISEFIETPIEQQMEEVHL
jgi:DNA-binding response OmpR family regulator